MRALLAQRPFLLEAIPATFIVTDAHSKIIYANRRAESFFGYAPDEMEGRRIRILFLEEDLIYFLPNIIFLSRYKKGFDGEALLKRKDGKKIFVHLTTSAFKEKGEVFLSFSFQEIQRLKSLEKERFEAEHWACLGKIMEEIAHQIRNPISAIGGYSKRLMKEIPSPPKKSSYYQQIIREANKLETILQRVEELVRIPPPLFQRENIQEVAEPVCQFYKKEAMEQRVTLKLITAGLTGDGQVYLDHKLTAKALSYILQNSLEALSLNSLAKKRKVIEIALRDNGKTVGVTVADQGPGIPPKNLRQIFDPFFSTRPDRVGLGLTFVRRAVEAQGGEIQVKSRSGKGTKISISFPKDRRRSLRRELVAPAVRDATMEW